MKVMIDLYCNPKKGDVLVFNGSCFEGVKKELLFLDTKDKIQKLTRKIEKLEEEIKILKGEE